MSMNERKIGILLSYINIALQVIINFLYVPILLYYIGQSEYGLYQLIGSLIAYFSIMDFGLSASIVRFYSKYKALNDTIKMENLLAFALRAYGVITILMLAVGAVFYQAFPKLFASSMTVQEIASAQNLLIILFFNIVATMSTMIFRAVINAHEKYLFLKGLETIQFIFQPLLVIALLTQYPNAMSVAIGQTILNLLLISARIYYCFVKLKISIKYHAWDKEMFKDFRKLALSLFFVAIIDQIFFKTNQVILGIVIGTSAVAVYSIAAIIYMNYMGLSLAISGVYLPHVTELVAKNVTPTELTNLFISIGRKQYYLLALVTSGFIIFGKQFINYWAGASFSDAYYMTLLIIIPFTIDLIQNIGNSIMQAYNRYDFRAKVLCFIGIFNLVIAIPLAQKYGGIGAAFATGLSMFISNGLIMNWFYYTQIKIDIPRFWREIGRVSLPIIPFAMMMFIISQFIITNSKLLFLLQILGYTLLYAILLYRFALTADEKEKVISIKRRLKF